MSKPDNLDALLEKAIAQTEEMIAQTEKHLAVMNALMAPYWNGMKPELESKEIPCQCSFQVNGKTLHFDVRGSHDAEEFGRLNPELIKAYERFLIENHAIELKRRLRAYVTASIRTKKQSYVLLDYGIDVIAIAKHLGPRPSPDHQIDHIIPLAAFDFNNPEQIRQAFAPENHQWLPRMKNSKKSDYWHYNGKRIKGRATWV